jgi:hypothetical protein
MALRTTAFQAAEALGWDLPELSKRSGIPLKTLYALRDGTRRPGPKTIAGLMRAFPQLPFERLFMPADSANADKRHAIAIAQNAVPEAASV